MTEKKKNLSAYHREDIPNGKDMKIGIVVSEWNPKVTESLFRACEKSLLEHGVEPGNIRTIRVPGTYELPSGANLLLRNGRFDGVICLGCVIKGETRHDEYISAAVAHGLTQLSLTVSKPVIFGVLTTGNMDQALDRAGGKHGNKGTEAAITAIKMIHLSKHFDEEKKTIGF
jgi:6,7-dimethyl-8-ribityllumazine synthase